MRAAGSHRLRNMQEINLYSPKSALVLYKTEDANRNREVYIESFEFDEDGFPINAHPLTEREAKDLSKAFRISTKEQSFLKPAGIMPVNILHFDPSENGSVTWHTKPEKRLILYVKKLGLPKSEVCVPALIWKATRKRLWIYAIAAAGRPTMKTKLYRAPFFNIGEDGLVCMGSVNVDIKKASSIEQFIMDWQKYFFESYFSHALFSGQTKDNIVSLWKHLHESGEPFPNNQLIPAGTTIKKLIS